MTGKPDLFPDVLPDLVRRATDLVGDRARVLLGVTGEPGSGKSTLAAALVTALNTVHRDAIHSDAVHSGTVPWAVHVPMDGFHLADVVLADLDLLDRKGAPETFDVHGYVALLARLRAAAEPVTYAPGFERDLEQPLAGALPVLRAARLVVTEGNYLLGDGPWEGVRAHLDQVWLCQVDDALRRRRLLDRHTRFGKSPQQAAAWVRAVDEPNAALVRAAAARADLVVRL